MGSFIMEGIGLVVLMISLLVVAPPTLGDLLLVPFERMEKAHHLLQRWRDWSAQNLWENESPPVMRGVVGATCGESAVETLRVMYFLRIRASVEKAWWRPGRGSSDEEREYLFTQHVARHLMFYAKKMTYPPLVDPIRMCQTPLQAPSVPSTSKGPLFHWPPDPYPLVCEAGKCVACAHAITSEVKEACNLLEPPQEIMPSPTEAHLIYEGLKKTLKTGYPDRKTIKRQQIHGEGVPCTAPPLKTLAYLTLTERFKFDTRDPLTEDAYSHEWNAIRVIARDLEAHRRMFEDFTAEDMAEFTYCNHYSETYDEGDRETGLLVCGGTTCKSCKEWPDDHNPNQRWSYERGDLHEACKIVTEIGDDGKLPPKTKEECPPIKPAVPCDPYRNRRPYEPYVNPCPQQRPGTRFEQWRSGSGACQLKVTLTGTFLLIGITFLQVVT